MMYPQPGQHNNNVQQQQQTYRSSNPRFVPQPNQRQPAHNMSQSSAINTVSPIHNQNMYQVIGQPTVMQQQYMQGQMPQMTMARNQQYQFVANQSQQYVPANPQFQCTRFYYPGLQMMHQQPSIIPQTGQNTMPVMNMQATAPPQVPQPQVTRKRNIITICDPNTNRDVTKEILEHSKNSSNRNSETPPGSSISGSSSARATPDDSITPPPTKPTSSSEIAAQFATQVAALAVPNDSAKSKLDTAVTVPIDSSKSKQDTSTSTPDKVMPAVVAVDTSISKSSIDNSEIQIAIETSSASVVIQHASDSSITNVLPIAKVTETTLINDSTEADETQTSKSIEITDSSPVDTSVAVVEQIEDDGNKSKKVKGKQRLKGLNDKGKEKEGGDMDAFVDVKEEAESNSTEVQPNNEEVEAVDELPTADETNHVEEPIHDEVPVESIPSLETNEEDMVSLKNKENSNHSQTVVENGNDDAEDQNSENILGTGLPKLRFSYKENQWSPINTDGKKQYDRAFLIQLQTEALSLRKPEGLPDLEVIKDKPITNTPRNSVDFTPCFMQSARVGRGSLHSTPRRTSQQGRSASTRHINITLSADVKLHEAENAWKPGVKKVEIKATDTDELDIQELKKSVRAILNKLTPQKFDTLVVKIKQLVINTPQKLNDLISLIFEKALDEPNFSKWYALLCQRLILMSVKDTVTEATHTFKTLLLKNCQAQFELDPDNDPDRLEILEAMKSAETEEKKAELKPSLDEFDKAAKRKTLGNIRFIGELFKLGMLSKNIMHSKCIAVLLQSEDEDSRECLCRLLTTIGKVMDGNDGKNLDYAINNLKKLVNDKKISSRIKFMMQDVIDLSINKWVPRREDNNPKTIDEIHKEAKKEALQEQIQNLNTGPRRNEDRSQRRGRGNGPPSLTRNTSDDGWNTVPVKAKFPEPSRLREIKKNMEDPNIMLGPGSHSFKMWGSGSSGGTKSHSGSGGEKNQSVDKNRNRFNALQGDAADEGKHNNVSQSGASSRDSSANRRRDSSSNRRRDSSSNRHRDSSANRQSGGRRMMPPRGNSRERQELLAEVANMATGNNIPHQRDSSSSRKVSQADSVTSNRKTEQLSEEVLILKSSNIISEFIINNSLDLTVADFREISSDEAGPIFIKCAIDNLLEKNDDSRHMVGVLFTELVRKNCLEYRNFAEVLNDVFEIVEDMLVDIPKFWSNISEFFAPMMNGPTSMALIVSVAQPLKAKDSKMSGELIACIMKQMCRILKSNARVHNIWSISAMKWTSFVHENEVEDLVKKHGLEFLNSPVSDQDKLPIDVKEIGEHLDNLFSQDSDSNNKAIEWIDATFNANMVESEAFIRELVTSVCNNFIKGEGTGIELRDKVFNVRVPFLKRYLKGKEILELYALFAIQLWLYELENPQGILRTLFSRMYDDEIISADTYTQWESNKIPTEQRNYAVLMKSLTTFFTWLHEPE